MNMQAELNFELAEASVKTLNDMALALLRDGRWYAPWELCEEIFRTRSIRVSDSTITARLRDLRKPEFGDHNILIRKRVGTRFFEYKLGEGHGSQSKKNRSAKSVRKDMDSV